MSQVGIPGAIAAATRLTGIVVGVFGTRRNAPRQVERLRQMLEELKDQNLIAAAQEGEQTTIAEMINRCTDLLERYAPEEQAAARLRTFVWPAKVENDLSIQNDEISDEINRLRTRISRSPVEPQPGNLPSSSTLNIQQSSYYPSPALSYRRDSLETIELPTTLTLQRGNGETLGFPMELNRLKILERDEAFRTIQYEATQGPNARQICITHRIPRGTIRFEDDDPNDDCVSFLDAHEVTIETPEGYSVFHTHAAYQFKTIDARDEFLIKVRERDMLGRFFAKSVRNSSGEILAQQQIVRIWRKSAERGPGTLSPKLTVSFLGRNGAQYELPLNDFFRKPVQDGDRVFLVHRNDGSRTIFEFEESTKRRKLFSRPFHKPSRPPTEPTSTDAAKFMKRFEELHPVTYTFPPVQSPPSPQSSPRIG